jgi:hypothetical protein
MIAKIAMIGTKDVRKSVFISRSGAARADYSGGAPLCNHGRERG